MEQWASTLLDLSDSTDSYRYLEADSDAAWSAAGWSFERRFPDEKGRLEFWSAGTRNALIVWGAAVALLGDRKA
jgi:hypothetical protein